MKKNYVVNGAAHPGFGEITARMLIGHGHKVFGLYELEDEDNAAKLRAEFSTGMLELICIDCTKLENLKDKISTIPAPLNGFVNACFMFDIEDINNFDYNLAEKLFRANYHAPMLMAVELKKKMVEGSAIVIVTSTEAERGSFGGISYAASKAAVHNLIKSLACNWGKKDQIRVNAVAAGWIGGEMDTDGPFAVSIDITPLGRLGRAEEVANTVDFLLSDKAGFINAQAIIVDGGYLSVDDIAKFEYEESKK
ncbi:MAG: SDR family oxidoreductase [Prevotellaceae bacterium]|jgi:NAD(P)-dependent dehydrogenase (short-subunit alcohol dehydrogenase family)|nr:SDR family oxidoreductase [Prevotellaceae bacterium]